MPFPSGFTVLEVTSRPAGADLPGELLLRQVKLLAKLLDEHGYRCASCVHSEAHRGPAGHGARWYST